MSCADVERTTLASTIAEGINDDRRMSMRCSRCGLIRPRPVAGRSTRARGRARDANEHRGRGHRALSEPDRGGGRFGTSAAAGVLANMRRLADGALALEADLPEEPQPDSPQARALARELDRAMLELAAAAREHRPPAPAEALRHAHEQLSRAAGPTVPLVTETDRMVNSALLAADVLAAAGGPADSASGESVTSAARAVSSR